MGYRKSTYLLKTIDPAHKDIITTYPIINRLVSSADNLSKQLDPDQAQRNVRPDLDPDFFDL